MKILLVCALVFSNLALAKTAGRVFSIKGNSFLFSKGNSPKAIKFAHKLPDLSEVMVEMDSHLSFKDSYGRVIHLGSGAHIKLKIYRRLSQVEFGWRTKKSIHLP